MKDLINSFHLVLTNFPYQNPEQNEDDEDDDDNRSDNSTADTGNVHLNVKHFLGSSHVVGESTFIRTRLRRLDVHHFQCRPFICC